jgi:hypothetical protein
MILTSVFRILRFYADGKQIRKKNNDRKEFNTKLIKEVDYVDKME